MDRDILLGCILILVILYIVVFKKTYLVRPLIVASLVSFSWTFLARGEYGYNAPVHTVLSLNLYVLFGWILSLMLGFQIFHVLHKRFPVKSWWAKLLLYNSYYLPLLILFESVAYHVFNVVNLATAGYSGLPLCDCVHAPHWMQLAYMLMGTVHMGLLFISYKLFPRLDK